MFLKKLFLNYFFQGRKTGRTRDAEFGADGGKGRGDNQNGTVAEERADRAGQS